MNGKRQHHKDKQSSATERLKHKQQTPYKPIKQRQQPNAKTTQPTRHNNKSTRQTTNIENSPPSKIPTAYQQAGLLAAPVPLQGLGARATSRDGAAATDRAGCFHGQGRCQGQDCFLSARPRPPVSTIPPGPPVPPGHRKPFKTLHPCIGPLNSRNLRFF